MVREVELYPAVKAFLERQGYTVKAEVAGADIVARRGSEAPVIVELKTRFSLALFHQGVARLSVTDHVYVAVAHRPGAAFARAVADNTRLARRLGLGLLTVRLRDGHVAAACDPGPYAPRKSGPRTVRLLREFDRRRGDPNAGGTKGKILTAYRQDALACAAHLAAHGPARGRDVRAATGVVRATEIMRADHYGWFERVSTGTYALTEAGRAGLSNWQVPADAP